MEDRLARLQDRASKRRQIAKDVMVELDLKKIAAPDFTASIRSGMRALMVIDEAAVPSIYWGSRAPRLNRQGLVSDLKQGAEITGVTLSNPEPVLSVRTRWWGSQQNRPRRCGGTWRPRMSAPVRPMAARCPKSKAGMRSRKPTGSLALMAGAGRRWTPAVCSPGRPAARSSPSISPGSGLQSALAIPPSCAKAMAAVKAVVPPPARSTTSHSKPQKPMPPNGAGHLRKAIWVGALWWRSTRSTSDRACPGANHIACVRAPAELCPRRHRPYPAALPLLWPAARWGDPGAGTAKAQSKSCGRSRLAAVERTFNRADLTRSVARADRQECPGHRCTKASAGQGASEVRCFAALSGLRANVLQNYFEGLLAKH
jgi:Siphovirus Gp157